MPTHDRKQSGKQPQGNRPNETDQNLARKQTTGSEGRDTKVGIPETDEQLKSGGTRDRNDHR